MISPYEKRLSVALIFVILVGSIFQGSEFLSLTTLNIFAHQIPELGLISLALMLAMVGSGINLAVVSMTTLSGILGAICMTVTSELGIFSFIIGIMVMLIVGGLAGAFNGFIISYLEVPAVLTTLGTMLFFRGFALNITKGGSITSFSESFIYIGTGKIIGVPLPFIIFAIVAIGLNRLLSNNVFGQQIYRIGKSKKSAKYSGIPVKSHIFKLHILSGLIIGIAAVVMTARYNSIRVDYGATYLMTSIVVVSLGGVHINGGKGSVLGVVLALLLVNIVIRIMNIANVDADIIDSVLGVLLLINIFIQYMAKKSKVES